MSIQTIHFTSESTKSTQEKLNNNFSEIQLAIQSIPDSTSDLTNDSNFVADASYVHTDNNYTTAEKTKLSNIEAGAEVNAIASISKNGTALTPDANKNVDIVVPTTASDVNALASSTKYGASLGVSGNTLQLKDQDGNNLGSSVTITTTDTNDNQTVKTGAVTFGVNDVVEIVGGTNVTVTGDASAKTITIASADTDTGATSVGLKSGDTGNAVTNMTYDSTTRKITFEKGETFQTATDSSLATTSQTVVGAINEVNSVAKQANLAKGFASYQALITELNSADADEYLVGQSFFVQTQDVPDLWVMSVESSSVTYTYTTDGAVVDGTGASGGLQVGYYKLAQLETQGVSLTNYVPSSRTIAGVDLQDNITQAELQTALEDIDHKFVTSTQKSNWNGGYVKELSFSSTSTSSATWSGADANGYYTLTVNISGIPLACYNSTSGEQIMATLESKGYTMKVITDTPFNGKLYYVSGYFIPEPGVQYS